MSNASDFTAKQAEIEAIPDEDIKLPNMPISTFLQEAENLRHWSQADKDALTGAGLDWKLVQDISVRAGALRQAESIWFKERYDREEAGREWEEKAPEIYDLRDRLLHALRYAFRDNNELLKRVSEIDEGYGHADMIQDLNDIAILGRENSDLLNGIKFDMSLLEQAATAADEMAQLLAIVTGDRQDRNSTKITRDKAYTYLKEAVDAVRECGQYVFWRNQQRLKGYTSKYHRQKNTKPDNKNIQEIDSLNEQ